VGPQKSTNEHEKNIHVSWPVFLRGLLCYLVAKKKTRRVFLYHLTGKKLYLPKANKNSREDEKIGKEKIMYRGLYFFVAFCVY